MHGSFHPLSLGQLIVSIDLQGTIWFWFFASSLLTLTLQIFNGFGWEKWIATKYFFLSNHFGAFKSSGIKMWPWNYIRSRVEGVGERSWFVHLKHNWQHLPTASRCIRGWRRRSGEILGSLLHLKDFDKCLLRLLAKWPKGHKIYWKNVRQADVKTYMNPVDSINTEGGPGMASSSL